MLSDSEASAAPEVPVNPLLTKWDLVQFEWEGDGKTVLQQLNERVPVNMIFEDCRLTLRQREPDGATTQLLFTDFRGETIIHVPCTVELRQPAPASPREVVVTFNSPIVP